MKKLFVFILPVVLLVSCHKDPDLSELDSDFVVFTDYDKQADFASQTTYYIPDSVLVVTGNEDPEYWTDSRADVILSAFSDNMTQRGYTKVTDRSTADIGLQVSFIKDAYYFYDYTDYPYWWWGYPGYWPPIYWGDYWGGWYYPYPIVYSYNVGSLLAEMINLKTPTPRNDGKIPVMWTVYSAGLLSDVSDINVELAKRSIYQAFEQSPYISK